MSVSTCERRSQHPRSGEQQLTADVMERNPKLPLRILLWSTRGAGLHYGGPGTSAFRLYSAATPGRFSIELAHALPHQERYPLFADQHQIARRIGPGLTGFQFFRASHAWLKENAARFDVFHGLRAFHETVVPAFDAQKMGLPAVVKPAAHRADLADKGSWRWILGLPRRRREMLKSISGVIAISRAISQELQSFGIPERKIVRIPNGVDTNVFHPADESERRRLREELGWRDLPTLLFVGAIVRRKRPHLLLEAAAFARRSGVECQVVLVGPYDHDAEYATEIQRRARDLGLAELLVMPGLCRNVSTLYRAADIFILPSSKEGLPNAALEAMASGLVTIVTPFEGAEDVIADHHHGLVIEPSAGALADAIVECLKTPSRLLMLGQAARQRALDVFSANAVLDAHEKMFRRIMIGADAAG